MYSVTSYLDRKRARNPVEVLDLPGPTLCEYTQHIIATGLEPHASTIENQT
jgi:hypothetical protein